LIFPPDGLRLSSANFIAVGEALSEGLRSGQYYRIRVEPWQEKRSLSQNALFHVWMRQLSEFLIARGRPNCSPDWCKDAMKFTFLGFEETEFVDVKTGARIVRETLKHTSKLKTGDMFNFMTNVQAWCLDIGCFLNIPESSEFFVNMKKQDG